MINPGLLIHRLSDGRIIKLPNNQIGDVTCHELKDDGIMGERIDVELINHSIVLPEDCKANRVIVRYDIEDKKVILVKPLLNFPATPTECEIVIPIDENGNLEWEKAYYERFGEKIVYRIE